MNLQKIMQNDSTCSEKSMKLTKLENEIQRLSLENSNLRSELQQKSKNIVNLNGKLTKLNDKLAKLNDADLYLQKNAELEKENTKLREKVMIIQMETEQRVSAIKRYYETTYANLEASLKSAREKETQAQSMIENEQKLIDNAAEQKICQTKLNLQSQAAACKARYLKENNKELIYMKAKLYFLTYGSTVYSIGATALTMIKSERFSTDLVAFFFYIYWIFVGLAKNSMWLSSRIWSLNDLIPYRILNSFIPGALMGICFVLTFCGPIILAFYMLNKIVDFISDYQLLDENGLVIASLSWAVLVWFADSLSYLRLNLIFVYLLFQVVACMVRIIHKNHKANKQSNDSYDVF